jgi:2-oxoglutarate ferredoxin oxidoreductase subunit beta
MSDCPSLYGRLNKLGSPADMMRLWADKAVTAERAKSMSEEELRDKVVYGRFVERGDRMEYTEKYAEVIRRAQEG